MTTWNKRTLAALLTIGLAGPALADDAIRQRDQLHDRTQDQLRDKTQDQTQDKTQDRDQTRQRLRDASATDATPRAKADCDGTQQRDRLRDGTGGSQARHGGRR